MKCPKCLKNQFEQDMEMESAICPICDYEIDTDHFIDSAELLRLVKKARKRAQEVFIGKSHLLNAICAYLSGDPSALKKLAGIEED
jgi:hypothetical protein